MIKLITPDGTETDLSEQQSGEPPFAWLCEISGIPDGYVEIVRILHPDADPKSPKPAQLIVHESGRLVGLPYNKKASDLYHRWPISRGEDPVQLELTAPIVGPAVLLTGRHSLT